MDTNNTPWFNSNWFAALIGAIVGGFISISIFFATNYINKKNQEKTERKNLLILLTQSNPRLFSIIHIGSLNKNKIDYAELRKELKNTSIIWILPTEVKEPFLELYRIHAYDSQEYDINKQNIYNCLVKIENEFNKYGVDLFGDK